MDDSQGLVNIEEVVELGKILHQNGDKVLNALSKLSLSTTLLHNLNKAFSLIVDEPKDLEASFQVCNSSKTDVFRDLKFLHDFVQKTIGLKITHCSNHVDTVVDITKFRHLKYLELKKINLDFVKGIQGIRGQLETIICAGRKGVNTVSQLLARCGGDAGTGFVWASLKHLALPHNTLQQLDTSLELVPWLQIIDLSHNQLTSANELSCLHHLKYVNLSYNKLETVPTFNKTSSSSLQVLVLKNNYIESLNGLQNMEYLRELDLSYNCLMKHLTLWPLEKMSSLCTLSLEGNPLSYHPKHRSLSIKHLHLCLNDGKFVLDRTPLSRAEEELLAENRMFTVRSARYSSGELLRSLADTSSLSSLTASLNNPIASDSSMDGRFMDVASSLERSLTKSKKKLNIKEAIIVEDENDKESKAEHSIRSSLGILKDHLETKKQILAVRERYGEDNWLCNDAGTFVEDIMGLQPTLTTEHKTKHLGAVNAILNVADLEGICTIDSSIERNSQSLRKENDEMNNDNIEDEDKVLNEEENSGLPFVDDLSAMFTNVSEEVYDPEEDTGDVYLVQKKKKNEEELEDLFLIVSPEDIKEVDAITRKLKYRWSTSSVLSCVLSKGEPITVDIIFDTTRKDRQNRRYFVELDMAKKIVETIGDRMKNRSIPLKVFKCMKCSTHFSQDSEYVTTVNLSGTKQLKCPICESTLVIESNELSTLDGENDMSEVSPNCLAKNNGCSKSDTKVNFRRSESSSSIGEAEGKALSVTNLVYSDSHTQAQAWCSAMSLGESRESTPSTNALNKKYESDIEVLSNPSQSSIEVLDDASKNQTTQRKRSSEESSATLDPSLLTTPDTMPIAAGLTESSSSGSLTDSICTAYENKTIRQTNADEESLNDNEKENKLTPGTNLMSMLGGLLQSIKIGSSKPEMLKSEEGPNFFGSDIQYSYTDFSSIDHRIKLHIILNIFEHENEELILLLRAEILMQSSKNTFPGCLVLSTSKVYVLKITGLEGEHPQQWLHKEASWTIDRLKCFKPLPFKQGLVVELDQSNKLNAELDTTITFLCILQDFQRTLNFLFYVTDFLLPPICEGVEFAVPEYCASLMHRLLKSCKNFQDDDGVRQYALFSSAVLKYQDFETQLQLSSLIVTASLMVICNMQWLLPGNNEDPQLIREQTMSNLIGLESHDSTLTLNFLDEVVGEEETWLLEFVSTRAMETVITSIRSPWEELFSIPLEKIIRNSQKNDHTEEVVKID